MTMIIARGLTKSFGSRTLWKSLDFDVESGEMVAVTGASGSGKSTLLNCVGLLVPLDAGEIAVAGRRVDNLRSKGKRVYRRDTLGFLFQNYALVEDSTIAQNLKLAVSAWGFQSPSTGMSMHDALAHVGLPGRERDPIHVLSGGEQQRVAVARLLMKRPPVVLADEPTGALDDKNGRLVVESLAQLAADGAAVMIATHNADVRDACDREIRL